MSLKKITAIVLTLSLILSLCPLGLFSITASAANDVWDGSTATGFASGTGTADSPYMIENANQLAYLVQSESTAGKYYALANDIYINDTSESNWTANARVWFSDMSSAAFAGHLEGNGYTINGIYLNETPKTQEELGDENYVADSGAGLFSYIHSDAVVRNVHIRNSYISGRGCVGAFAGHTAGTRGEKAEITGCSVDESVTLRGYTVGGFIGMVRGAGVQIFYCYSTADIGGTGTQNRMNAFIGDDWGCPNDIMNSYSVGYEFMRGITVGVTQNNYSNVDGRYATVVPTSSMYGEAAKTAMPNLSWDEVWIAVDGKTPQLKVVSEGFSPFDEGVKGRVWSGKLATKFAGGTGTEEDPYLIETPEQMAYLVYQVGKKNTYYKLTANLKLNDTSKPNWTENAKMWLTGKTFSGHFDGGGHTVSGLYYNLTDSDYCGLFPQIAGSSTIKRVGVVDSYLSNDALGSFHTYTGAIVGFLQNWDGYMGGALSSDGVTSISGEVAPVISECFVAPDVIIVSDTAGGILGGGAAGIKFVNCFSTPTLIATYRSGGIFGDLWESHEAGVRVENCYVATPYCDKLGAGSKYTEDATQYLNAYFHGTLSENDPEGVSALDISLMQGENAKENMIGFDYEKFWTTVENGTPVLRGFEDAEKYSRIKVSDEDSTIKSGTTGECSWILDGTELTIYGNGKMGDLAEWGRDITKVIICDGVTSIGNFAFFECSELTSVTIPNSVTDIGIYTFYGCAGLTSVTIPDSVTSIESYAFYGCSGIASVTFPNSVTSIGDSAFSGCTGLTSITIPDNVTSIGYGAFRNCTGLTSVTIGNSVASIGDYAFSGCENLEKIVCVKGSYAEAYAIENDIPVEYMAEIREFNIILDTRTPIGEEIPIGVEAYFEVTPSTADASGLYMLFNWKVSSDGIVYDFCREGDVFEDGKYYALAMGLRQLDGIDETTVWKLNGKPFELFEIGCNYDGEISFSDDAVFITYATKIKEFNAIVDISTPVGQTIPMGVESTFEVTPSTANASGLYMRSNWAVSSDGIVFDLCRQGDVFEAGKYYALISGLGSFEGIDDDTVWLLNGKPFEFLEIGWEIDGTIDFQPVALFISEKLKAYTPGDLTGDDKINSLDGLMLMRYLNGWNNLNIASPEAMDVNADGKVNSLDGLLLMRYLNGWNVQLG